MGLRRSRTSSAAEPRSGPRSLRRNPAGCIGAPATALTPALKIPNRPAARPPSRPTSRCRARTCAKGGRQMLSVQTNSTRNAPSPVSGLLCRPTFLIVVHDSSAMIRQRVPSATACTTRTGATRTPSAAAPVRRPRPATAPTPAAARRPAPAPHPARLGARGGPANVQPSSVEQPVGLARVAHPAGRDAVVPRVRATAAARHHVVDRVGLAAAVGAAAAVPAQHAGAGHRHGAAVGDPDVAGQAHHRRARGWSGFPSGRRGR